MCMYAYIHKNLHTNITHKYSRKWCLHKHWHAHIMCMYNTYTNTDIHIFTQMTGYMHKHWHTHIHANNTYTRVMRTLTHTYRHTNTYTHIQTHKHTRSNTQTLSHAHTHTYTRTRTHRLIRPFRLMQLRDSTDSHTHTHTHMHARRLTRAFQVIRLIGGLKK